MQKNSVKSQIKGIIKEYPGLTFNEKGGMLHGVIAVDEDDDYQIEIDINPFPDRFPLVKETGERIAPIADNHMYSDGNCCFTTAAKEHMLLRKGLIKTLPQFVSKILIPFLQNNSYREINGTYQNGEYSHGVQGIVEAYSDILGVENKWVVISTLVYFLNHPPLRTNNNICYCGSRKLLEECHGSYYENLKYIPIGLIDSDLTKMGRIKKIFN